MKMRLVALAAALLALGSSCSPEGGSAVNAQLTPSDHYLSSQRTHNKWDRSLEPILRIRSGETVTVETKEASDGQITPQSTVADVAGLDLDLVHPLTGPIAIEGAQPGDVIQVDLLEFELPDWGWTIIAPPSGFLGDEFKDPYLKLWQLNRPQGYAELKSGVRVPIDKPFLGVIGLAWDEEGRFVTFPPRTHGGNMDIKHLSAGTTVYLPVALPGGLLSLGDGHAAQGDGEVCISAIECDMKARIRVTLRKDMRIKEPQYEGLDFYATTGFATTIDEAARKATRYMIDHLVQVRGLSREEAYVLCSVSVDLQISEAVDMPHYLVSARLPKSVFHD